MVVRRPALLASGAPRNAAYPRQSDQFSVRRHSFQKSLREGRFLDALGLFAVSERALFDGHLIRVLMGFPLPLPECCSEIGSGKRKSAACRGGAAGSPDGRDGFDGIAGSVGGLVSERRSGSRLLI
jgi:hypothetical protein